MGVKRTQEQFENDVKAIYGDSYTVIGKYMGLRKPVKVKHTTCGREIDVNVYNFLKGKVNCPRCGTSPNKNHEDFLWEVNQMVGDEYVVESQYTSRSNHVDMRHMKCGKVNKVIPMNFIKGHRCPKCALKGRWYIKGVYQKTTEEFKSDIESLFGEEYTVVGEYAGTQNTVKVQHNTCGRIYDAHPSSLMLGRGCQKCKTRLMRKTPEQFLEEVDNLVGDEYTFLEEYTTARDRLLVRHNVCGSERKILPHSFLQKARCPNCTRNKKVKRQDGLVKEV